jgi:hypothetical protein
LNPGKKRVSASSIGKASAFVHFQFKAKSTEASLLF